MSKADRWLSRQVILATPKPTPEELKEREATKREYVQRALVQKSKFMADFEEMQRRRNQPTQEVWQPLPITGRKPRGYAR